MAAKLPTALCISFYRATVVLTMEYGSEAWMFTDKIRKKVNGVNSKLLSQITRRTIHEEASQPTFNTIDHVLSRSWQYLGHILRLDESRALNIHSQKVRCLRILHLGALESWKELPTIETTGD